MWNKILEINWKNRAGKNENAKGSDNELIDGTNGATIKKMKGVNSLIRVFLSAVEIPLFGAAVLAIVIIGERNFWSPQVRYQTEPIASVGRSNLRFRCGMKANRAYRSMAAYRGYRACGTRLAVHSSGSRYGSAGGRNTSQCASKTQ